MREIKFKVWDKSNPEKPMMWANTLTIKDIWEIGYEAKEHEYHAGNYEGKAEHSFKDYEFLQFTGLTEISVNGRGKDIYENDEIEWNIFPYDNISGEKTGETVRVRDIVKFSNGCFKLEKRGGLLCTILEPHREVKIIGNIHERAGK